MLGEYHPKAHVRRYCGFNRYVIAASGKGGWPTAKIHTADFSASHNFNVVRSTSVILSYSLTLCTRDGDNFSPPLVAVPCETALAGSQTLRLQVKTNTP
jgi:hypothetical protein